MSFFRSLPEAAGPPHVFRRHPEIYAPFAAMSEALMNGPSPFSQGEREMILAFAAGLSGCDFVFTAHSEVAYAWGVQQGLLDALLTDVEAAGLEDRMRPVMCFVRKLVLHPNDLGQHDADAVFAAGWDEHALHDAVAVAARAAMMCRMAAGFGFAPLERQVAASHARKRVERGYVDLYRFFRTDDGSGAEKSDREGL